MSDAPRDFTRSEEAALLRAVAAGEIPRCPRCGVPLNRRRVPPRHEVAYVRRRSWWLCGSCRRGLVVDDRRLQEER